MWQWRQAAGELWLNGQLVSRGYAGRGRGINNPALQGLRGIGPIPQGRWLIQPPRTSQRTGPFVLDLVPAAGTDALGRSAFQIHGDRVSGPPRTASSGCIILQRSVRERIWRSGVHVIEVVP